MPIQSVINDGAWPQPLVDLVLDNERKEDGRVHVTALNACLRQMVLKFTEPYEVHTSKLYPLIRGIAFHDGVASLLKSLNQPHLVVEKNVRREINGFVISGTCDLIDTKEHVIIDWKLPLKAASKIWPAYIAQLNVYGWLASAEFQIDRILLAPWDPYGLRVKEIERWPDEKVEAYLINRTNMLKGAGLPPPEAMEWEAFHCNNCPVYKQCRSKEDILDYV
jgi:hypothetical protein